ncbi:MAG: sigma 54-interacting transcriptional regulator [Clostridia bacterium]|nr:sigma 54-interacting transcriptional regulator [Clostridia bacterium]
MSLNDLVKMSGDILESLYDGIAIVDMEGTVVFVNEANYRITGVESKAILGRNVREAVPDSHLPHVLNTGNRLIGVKTEVNSKKVISNIVPIIIDGRMEGAISVFRDISEVLSLSQKLEEANSTIEHLFEKLNFKNDIESHLVIGNNKQMENVLRLTQKASQVASTVLLQGESGTGKEVIARMIHRHSSRAEKPFVAVNCAAIPDSLLESELFGYDEGAFTGAKKGGRPGLFELAHEGTIFLDEIGDMSMALQAKLLRVLQDRQITRIGAVRQRKVDVRVIAATNKNLMEMVKVKTFREDLYYRLEVVKIHIPPLRERKEDIHLYIDNALRKIAGRIGKRIPQVSPKVLRCLMEHTYPGNIRELENIVEVALVSDENGILGVDDLPDELMKKAKVHRDEKEERLDISFENFPSFEQMEKTILQNAVNRYKSKAEISRVLHVSRSTLYRKLEQYGLLGDTLD